MNFENQLYRLIEVYGDGNCLYHALQRHSLITQAEDGVQLRLLMHRLISQKLEELKNVFISMDVDEVMFLKNLRSPGHWGSNVDCVLFSILFNVNVVIITNAKHGMWTQSSVGTLEFHGIDGSELLGDEA